LPPLAEPLCLELSDSGHVCRLVTSSCLASAMKAGLAPCLLAHPRSHRSEAVAPNSRMHAAAQHLGGREWSLKQLARQPLPLAASAVRWAVSAMQVAGRRCGLAAHHAQHPDCQYKWQHQELPETTSRAGEPAAGTLSQRKLQPQFALLASKPLEMWHVACKVKGPTDCLRWRRRQWWKTWSWEEFGEQPEKTACSSPQHCSICSICLPGQPKQPHDCCALGHH